MSLSKNIGISHGIKGKSSEYSNHPIISCEHVASKLDVTGTITTKWISLMLLLPHRVHKPHVNTPQCCISTFKSYSWALFPALKFLFLYYICGHRIMNFFMFVNCSIDNVKLKFRKHHQKRVDFELIFRLAIKLANIP